MLHFEHNCSIKGLCKVEDVRKLLYLTTYLIKLKTKFQDEQRCGEQANAN